MVLQRPGLRQLTTSPILSNANSNLQAALTGHCCTWGFAIAALMCPQMMCLSMRFVSTPQVLAETGSSATASYSVPGWTRAPGLQLDCQLQGLSHWPSGSRGWALAMWPSLSWLASCSVLRHRLLLFTSQVKAYTSLMFALVEGLGGIGFFCGM